jgi:hypothetical protein
MRISVDGTIYEFDENTADNIELMAIERVTGMTTTEWADAVTRGSMLGITALIWTGPRRNEPTLEFGDVHFLPVSLRMLEDGEPGKDAASSPTT